MTSRAPSAPVQPPGWVADETLARAAWSRLVEPGDVTAGFLIGALGASEALAWVLRAVGSGDPAQIGPDVVAGAVHELSELPGALTPDGLAAIEPRLARALPRWAPRVDGLDPRPGVEVLRRYGGHLVHPGTPGWPVGLDDLGQAAPACLWVRGRTDLDVGTARSVAIVGARASTAYGERVAVEMAAGLAERGVCVVSGGAYGIDAAAHRGALVAQGRTVVLLAGGVDRAYPAGNSGLLAQVLDRGGTVLSEVPPGAVPTRSRFLLRNRLVAAVSRATVVVEAAWRSGALSTARQAADLFRPVGAVPGPVTSMASAGCHRLLREGVAVCVTDVAEVVELAGSLGVDLAPEPADPPGPSTAERLVLDALPRRAPAGLGQISREAGLSVAEAAAALGALELDGRVRRTDQGWRLVPPGR